VDVQRPNAGVTTPRLVVRLVSFAPLKMPSYLAPGASLPNPGSFSCHDKLKSPRGYEGKGEGEGRWVLGGAESAGGITLERAWLAGG
jgi:hypothetical protein